MRFAKPIILLCSAFIVLAAASCSRGMETTISDVAVATGITTQNAPKNNLEEINASTQDIYLAARVNYPSSATQIHVRWYQLPSQLIAQESFNGRRSSTHPFDFDKDLYDSFFASRVQREGISWPTGEYRIEVWLGDQLAKTVFFRIISDAEAQQQATASQVRQIWFGDALTHEFKVGADRTAFSRATNDIHIQIDLVGLPPSTEVRTNIRYIKKNQQVASFVSEVTGDRELVLSLSRERFGQLWPDRLWPEGTFEVTVTIGGVQAKIRTFQVQS